MASQPKGTPVAPARPPALPDWVETTAILAVCSAGLFLFFRHAITTGFYIYPGDLGDWRFNGIIAEHWFSVLKGQAHWQRPIFFYPTLNTLGYSDALILFVPFYVPFRLAGIEPSLAFVFCFMSVLSFGFI